MDVTITCPGCPCPTSCCNCGWCTGTPPCGPRPQQLLATIAGFIDGIDPYIPNSSPCTDSGSPVAFPASMFNGNYLCTCTGTDTPCTFQSPLTYWTFPNGLAVGQLTITIDPSTGIATGQFDMTYNFTSFPPPPLCCSTSMTWKPSAAWDCKSTITIPPFGGTLACTGYTDTFPTLIFTPLASALCPPLYLGCRPGTIRTDGYEGGVMPFLAAVALDFASGTKPFGGCCAGANPQSLGTYQSDCGAFNTVTLADGTVLTNCQCYAYLGFYAICTGVNGAGQGLYSLTMDGSMTCYCGLANPVYGTWRSVYSGVESCIGTLFSGPFTTFIAGGPPSGFPMSQTMALCSWTPPAQIHTSIL
jgi:hypothetical protein